MGLFGRDSQTKTQQRPVQSQKTPTPGPHVGSTTIIAEGCKVSGDIGGSSDLRVEGEFEGSVSISGIVFVAESGQVRTSIRAAKVTVSGRVDGNIFGDQMIELEPTAVVNGDLLAPKILIREGASLQGRVEMASPSPATAKSQVTKGKKQAGNPPGRKNRNDQTTEKSGDDDTTGNGHNDQPV